MTEEHLLHERTTPKRFYRSRHHRIIAGLAGGLAEYFNMDPTIMRILFILVLMLPGPGLVAYLLSWLLIPLEPQSKPSQTQIAHT